MPITHANIKCYADTIQSSCWATYPDGTIPPTGKSLLSMAAILQGIRLVPLGLTFLSVLQSVGHILRMVVLSLAKADQGGLIFAA